MFKVYNLTPFVAVFISLKKSGFLRWKFENNSLEFTNRATANWCAGTVVFVAPIAAVVIAVAAENFLDAARKGALKFVILAHRLLKVCERKQAKWRKL
jgi:hypothetical protein